MPVPPKPIAQLLTAYSVFMCGARLWDSWAISSNVDRDDLVNQAPVHSTANAVTA